MKNKLLLEEDELIPNTEEVIEEEPAQEEEVTIEEPKQEDIDTAMTAGLVSDLIKSQWDIINQCHSIKINPLSDEFNEVLDLIIDNTYINIGQLEKLIQNEIPAAETIEDGKELA